MQKLMESFTFSTILSLHYISYFLNHTKGAQGLSKKTELILKLLETYTDKWYFGGSKCILGVLVDWEKISLLNYDIAHVE